MKSLVVMGLVSLVVVGTVTGCYAGDHTDDDRDETRKPYVPISGGQPTSTTTPTLSRIRMKTRRCCVPGFKPGATCCYAKRYPSMHAPRCYAP